ncbi:cell division ATP-binding protein FtsE [Thalassospira lucentensis]|uniref:Cell division ATP-binding protein FtsE n=2 Tax=Thalassospira TaxID=168934 RepID=A0A367XI66_9PROT|nr:cell division ATP-binding protein FtsE [Thalassospira xiamenensis]KZB69307.1 cell division ATP-binding protein FtsE [Thalassospira lucentensis]RCK53336.1 cell division protein FtsE [Thalassospira xiamenensis]
MRYGAQVLTEVVSFRNVGVRYESGPEILRDLNFTLHRGSFHFLTGASGAGKSTLMRLLYLALRQTRGEINIFGRDNIRIPRDELPAIRRRIGVVFQDFRLINHLTTFENVALPLRVAGVEDLQIRKNVTELLEWVGLGDQINAVPSRLSGGQQQRVAIARAVIGRPALLLADEPTGNVDDRIAMRLLYLFEELNKLGTTVLIATHNRQLVRRFGHNQWLLEAGTLHDITHSA